MRLALSRLSIATSIALACNRAEDPPPTPRPASVAADPIAIADAELRDLRPPSRAGTSVPDLHRDAKGRVWLSFVDTSVSPAVLRASALVGDLWSDPVTVTASPSLFVNWADVPRLASFSDGTLAAVWPERFDREHAYGLRWSVSADDGASWSAPQWLPADQTGPEYGFVSFVSEGETSLRAFWLDGRATAGHGEGAMQLRSAVLHTDGTATDRRLVDDRVCDCCPTAAASGPGGPHVAYRDRSDSEVRDIRLATPATQGDGALVHADGWTIEGCPVNGPAVGSIGDRVVVAWFTAAKDAPRVLLRWPAEAAQTPLRIDNEHPLGRIAMATMGTSVAVAWLEAASGGRKGADLLMRTVAEGGTLGPEVRLTTVSAGRESGIPRLVADGDHLIAAWTEVNAAGTGAVHVARVSPPV